MKAKLKDLLQHASSRSLLNIGMLLFVAILLVLVLFEPGKDAEVTKQRNLTELKQTDIDEIELKRPNSGDIKIRKKDDIWYLTSPYQLPANDFRAQSVSALAELKSHLQYDISKVSLEKFKLDKPEVSIILNDDVRLDIGGVDPINNRRYVKNGDTLHLVSDSFYYQIVGQITSYISYQIIPPDMEITKIILPKFSMVLDNGNWKLSPIQKDVSVDQLNEFLDEWRHAQSLEISEYKGRSRQTDIQVFYKNQVHPLEFSLMKKNDSIYLVRKDLKLSYKLSDETAEKLQKLPPPPEEKEPEAEQPATATDKPAE